MTSCMQQHTQRNVAATRILLEQADDARACCHCWPKKLSTSSSGQPASNHVWSNLSAQHVQGTAHWRRCASLRHPQMVHRIRGLAAKSLNLVSTQASTEMPSSVQYACRWQLHYQWTWQTRTDYQPKKAQGCDVRKPPMHEIAGTAPQAHKHLKSVSAPGLLHISTRLRSRASCDAHQHLQSKSLCKP